MGIMNLFRKQEKEILQVAAEETGPKTGGLTSDGESHKFSEWLLEKNLVRREHIVAALMEQRVTGDRVGTILVRCGFMRHSTLIDSILKFSPDRIATENVMNSRIPVEVLEQKQIIISAETTDTIYVATSSDEEEVLEIVQSCYPDKKVVFVAFVSNRMQEFVERVRRTTSGLIEDVRQDEILDRLLFRAMKEGASDIHIEQKIGRSYSVFFRMLGDRHLVHEGSIEEYNVISTQAKDRSSMDLAERRINQDGGFSIEHSGKFVDLRLGTVPTVSGEKLVIRILDPDAVRPSLAALGISNVSQWERGTSRQNGLNLICGSTGSGKTTTLTATLHSFDRFKRSIYTVEDPVEYKIPYVAQVSTNPQIGLDFPRAIKSFMRADPDIIIVGEIRDAETARNAVKAADTGHLVIGTLHTGSILQSLSRLRDIGVPSNELRFNLRSVLVQTLMKVICRQCGGLGLTPNNHSERCPVCKGTGYAERTIVSECASFDDFRSVDKVIEMSESAGSFSDKLPWEEMIDDAINKMVKGVTSYEELVKVFGIQARERLEARSIDWEKHLLPHYTKR